MTDSVAADGTRTLEDPLAEALRIVDAADRQGLLVRLMGGMAIRAHAPDWTHRTRRVEVDLDFATRSQGPRRRSTSCSRPRATPPTGSTTRCSGSKQAYFVDVPRKRPVDVLVDSARDVPPLRLRRPPVGRRRRRCRSPSSCCRSCRSSRSTARTCSTRSSCSPSTRSGQDDGDVDARQGLRRDQRAADPVVHLERLGLVADRHRQPRQARPSSSTTELHARGPRRRRTGATSGSTRRSQVAALCAAAIDDAPKSTRWKLRARVGERQYAGTTSPRSWPH